MRVLIITIVAANECVLDDVEMERRLRDGFGSAASTAGSVPVIDMRSSDVADELWEAATTVGFFTVVNHGLPSSTIENAFDESRKFFELPLDVKKAASPYEASLNAGFEHMQQVRPSTGLPDVKESIQVTARDEAMRGRWPSAQLEDATRLLMEQAHRVATDIMTVLESKLPHVKMAQAHTLWTNESQCTLRMLHYPPVFDDVPPGSFRAGAHTDWGCVTLLFQQPGNQGLECAANPRLASSWVPVDPIQGGIAVNIGDMLSRWSHGALLSNLHRVRMPEDPTKPRYSIAFFAQADKHTLLTLENDLQITAQDYILGRIRSNFEAKFA